MKSLYIKQHEISSDALGEYQNTSVRHTGRQDADLKREANEETGVHIEKLTIFADDGYALRALFIQPRQHPIGTIILSAATGVKKEFYLNFARFLSTHGYRVLLYDYRGIGESAPPDLKKSVIFMHEWGTLDMNAVLNYVVIKKGYSGIIWLGHSIGAQLIGFLENKHHVRKVVAINAAVGYWKYFPYPTKILIWLLWHVVSPVMIKCYGYGAMKKIGWGENLPRNTLVEWRGWCTSKNYYMNFLKEKTGNDRFYDFTIPIAAIYVSDDYIANDRSAPLMMQFFPNAPCRLIKLDVHKYTEQKVGHTGMFRKRFELILWPWLLRIIQG